MDSLKSWLRRDFFLFMALLIAAVVAYGFGPGLNAKLIHPPLPRPPILYVHAAMFAAFVLLFVTQAALVRTGRIGWHRRLGIAGIVLGCAMPVVGTMTALVTTKINIAHGDADGLRFLIFPIFYMIAFAVLFVSAVLARRMPEFHRRLMLVAACTLTVAAFARFPGLPIGTWDACVDGLIALAVARDWIVTGGVHVAYRYALPPLILGQAFANYTYFSASPWWLAVAHNLVG